jgi:hypothetical protein
MIDYEQTQPDEDWVNCMESDMQGKASSQNIQISLSADIISKASCNRISIG